MRSLFLCCLLVACPSWAAVSACSGTVYDVGKGAYSRDPTVENRDDSRLCWAAAAANLIQYWQDSYYTSHNAEGALPPDGKNGTSYQSPVGTQYLAVYDAFVANFQNQGSQCSAGIDWWMKGTAAIDPAYQATLKEGADAAGYYSVLFDGLPSSCIVSLENQADAEHLLTDTLGQVLSRAGGALELGVSTAAGSGHAISCWGYETNAAGELTALYVTDSDDQRYGAFKLDVSKGEDGSLWVSSHNVLTSYGKNREPVCIRVVQYINTPESIAREAAAPADTLTGTEVTQNTCLTGDYRLTNLSIKPEAMLLATAGSLVLQGDAELSAANGLTVEDGALLSLSGLSRMESSGFSGVGMALTGRAYFSGVEHFVCEENGGGGLTNAVYLELRQCDSLSVRENSSGSADAPTTMAAGICNRQSMSILSCDSVQIADNKTVGQNVWGGGLLSLAGDLSDNRELVVACNQALSETAGSALGGGAYLIYANDITGNTSVQLTDNTAQIAAQDAAGECLAAGGGLLQTVYGGMACTSHWLRNDELVIARNKVIATCSGDSAAGAAVAQGGGLCIATQRDTVGSAGATIGSNTIVRIEDNSAEATHAGGAASAQGGGVYIGANGTLNMQENGSVSVAGNRADQGGAVYNSGCWSLRSNGSVSVSGNVTADRSSGALHNAAGATMELVWNDSVVFSGNKDSEGSAGYDVVNAGTLYLAAEAGHGITLGSGGLSSAGTTYVGCDAAGQTGSGWLAIQVSDSLTTVMTPATELGSGRLVACSLSGSALRGLDTAGEASGLSLTCADSAFELSEMSLSCFSMAGASALTLSTVSLDNSCSLNADAITLNQVDVRWQLASETLLNELTYVLDCSSVFCGCLQGELNISMSDSDMWQLYQAGYRTVSLEFSETTDIAGLTALRFNNAAPDAAASASFCFTLSVPEPGSAALFLAGLACGALRRRRERAEKRLALK